MAKQIDEDELDRNSDSGYDTSYTPENDCDDETTMLEAETEERLERRQLLGLLNEEDDDQSTHSFEADPVELQKLQEESDMNLDQVIERLRSEAPEGDPMQVDDGIQKPSQHFNWR